MLIRDATQEDSLELIKLTALSPMKGTIELRIDRNPDFFNLLKQRGSYKVLVAEDKYGKIIGSFSAALQYFFVNQNKQPVYYLCDFKIHPLHKGTTLAFRLVDKMYQYLKDEGAALLFCTAAHGNHAVMEFFEGRVGIPAFKKIANFIIYQILPRRLSKPIRFEKVNETGLSEFYNSYYYSCSFHPVVSQIDGCTHFVSRNENKIFAAVSVFDPALFKQNVLIHYPFTTGIALRILRLVKPIFNLPSIPHKGDQLKILYVKYFGFSHLYENSFLKLMQQVRHFAYENKYHFVSISIDEKDIPLNKLIKPLSRFNFRSIGLLSNLQNDNSLIESIRNGISYEDFSLV